jgi:hypothetical protein
LSVKHGRWGPGGGSLGGRQPERMSVERTGETSEALWDNDPNLDRSKSEGNLVLRIDPARSGPSEVHLKQDFSNLPER